MGAQPQLPLTATQQGRGGQGSGSGQSLSLGLRDLCPWTFAPNFLKFTSYSKKKATQRSLGAVKTLHDQIQNAKSEFRC